MKAHKFSKYFPAMSADEFQRLVDDIKTNGLIEPITIFEGAILDGVHREKACKKAKVEPRYEEWTDTNPLKWVMSKNLIRRHLEEGQRTLILIDAGLIDLSDLGGGDRSVDDLMAPKGGLTIPEAAAMAGVGQTLVSKVRTVAREDTELADEIRSGKKSAALAYETLRVKKFGEKTGTQKEATVLLNRIEIGEVGSPIVGDILAATQVAYEYGDIGRVKELLRTPYNRHTHTAEAEKERQTIAEELDQKKMERRQKMQWEDVPEVAAILRAFRGFREATPKFIKALEMGKFAPEAKRFLAEKLGKLITEVRGLLRQLEELREKLQ